MGQSLSGWEAGHFRKGRSKIDHEEMSRLIEGEIPRLRRFARCLARDDALADDLVQDCLLRAISRFDTWEPGTNLRAWLMTILRNVFITELRRVRRTPATIECEDTRQAAAHAGMQDHAIDLAAVQRAFDRLSDDHREILLFVALEEFSYGEAASVLNLPVGTVRSRLSRARTALRELVSDIQETAGEVGRSSRTAAGGVAASLDQD